MSARFPHRRQVLILILVSGLLCPLIAGPAWARASRRAGVGAPPFSGQLTALQLAEQSEDQGRYAEAIAHYREHLAKFPDDNEAQFRLARVLGWSKQYAESEAILRDWVLKHPDRPEGFIQLGRVLSWDSKFQDAAGQYQKGLELRPQDATAHLELARILSWIREHPRALDEFRTALSLQPDNLEAKRGVIQALIWNGEPVAARRELEDLRRKHPDDPQINALQQELEAFEARQARAQAVPGPGAEQYLQALVEKEPGNVDRRLELADVLLSRRDIPAAVRELREATALRPEDDALRLRLGRVLSWNQEYPEAVRVYREWLTKHPDDQQVHLELARVLSWGRSYDDSIAEYQGVLKRDPDNAGVRLETARVLSWAKRYDQAAQEFDALLRQDAKNFDAWVGKGRVYSYQSRWRESLAAFDSALAIKPGDHEAQVGRTQALLWSGETAAARDMLARLRSENPSDTAVLVSLASAENSLGRPDRALDLLEEAESLAPKNPDVKLVRDQVRAGLRPELRLGWSYLRDTEGLNIWRYQVADFRFYLHPRVRSFLTVDVLPTSAPVRLFGYPIYDPEPLFAGRVPVDPYVPAPTLLSASDFPPELILPSSARFRQSALQFLAGSTMQVNQWFSWTAGAGAIMLRHGSPDLASAGFPSARTRFIYTASPTFHLGRHWQITLGSSRQYWAYTPKAISQSIHADELSASITWMPSSLSRIAVGYYHRRISPEFLIPDVPIFNADFTAIIGMFPGRAFRKHGNGGTLTATRTVLRSEKGELEVGYDAMAFGYAHPAGLPSAEWFLNTGIFTPSFYQRHAGLVRVTLKPSRYVNWDLHGSAGGQQVRQGTDLGFSSTAGSRLDFLFSPNVTLSLGYDYFNAASAFQAFLIAARAAAYHSNNVTATLRIRF